jgi:hypothetical protein
LARPHPEPALLAAVLALLGLAATYRQGAFYSPASAVVVLVAVALVLARLTLSPRPPLRDLEVLGATVLLAGWWMLSAVIHGDPGAFFPLGAGILAFGCAFVIASGLPDAARSHAAAVLLGVGAVSGVAGLVSVVLRWSPLASPSQGLWRLASTLTYSNAAGALLALSLLVGLSLNPQRAWVRLGLFFCVASVVATQSRGAVLAAAIALCLIPWSALRQAMRPLALGLGAGLFTVALSPGETGHPAGLVVLAGLAVVAGTIRPRSAGPVRTRTVLVTAGAMLVVVIAALTVLHTPITRRLGTASSVVRGSEWTAAFRQWVSSPWVGRGPDQSLHVVSSYGNTAQFAHNEYLQILAGGGVIGALLLVLLGIFIIRAVRRPDLVARCGCAALLAFAITGALDFDWHLPALCLWAGYAGGLATRRTEVGAALPSRQRSLSRTS